MEKITIEKWNRRAQYEMASHLAFPFYHVSFPLDVEGLYDYAKEYNLSFYYSLVFLATQVLNDIENFRYRIRQDEVWLIDTAHPSFTFMKSGSDLFQIATCKMENDMKTFCEKAKQQSEEQTVFMDEGDVVMDEQIYFSSLPWMEILSVSNERDNDPNDSIPRITWGKYGRHEGKLILTMAVEVNHRLVDGVHIGMFYNRLQEAIYNLKK